MIRSVLPLDRNRPRPIRVCHVQVLPILSGAQRSMLELLRQLDYARYDPHVVCQSRGPLTDELERMGIRYTTIPALVRPVRPWHDLRAYFALRRFFRRQRFDIVHTHSSKPGIVARVAARHAGVPCVVHHVRAFAFHEFSPRPKRWCFSRIERWAARYCDQVLFVNHEERLLSIRNRWIPATKCRTIYNGVDLARLHPQHHEQARRRIIQQFGLDPDDVLILVSGRLDYPKQPLLLADIAAALGQLGTGANWRMLVAGDGAMQAPLAARISQLGLQDRVRLLGWTDQTDPLTLGCDVMLMTSLAEGLPRVLIEAQAAGLPSVAGNAKGCREVITPETGILCHPRDADSYARALARLIDDPLHRRRLGRAARLRAESLFDTVDSGQAVMDVYEQLLASPMAIARRRAA